MALGGRVSVFGVKFLNRFDIRNFHECYPLVNAKKLMRARCKNSFATLILILRILKFFVFFDHPFQLFIEIRNFFFQPFVDVYTQNSPPYHRPCVADFFCAPPVNDTEK